MWHRLSFRNRFAAVHLLIVVIVLAAAVVGAHWSLERIVHGQLDSALLSLAQDEAALLQKSNEPSIRVHEAVAGPTPPSFVRLDRLIQISDGDGDIIARSANLGFASLPASKTLQIGGVAGIPVFETLPMFGEEPTRMVSIALQKAGRPLVVQVAGSLDDVTHVVDAATSLLVAMAMVLLLAVGTAGVMLTGRVFQSIDKVVAQARDIGHANLSARLPHPGTQDEIGRLVDTLNDMLNRLEQAFESQRRFTADASHELRSPLSRLRTELEVTLRRPRDAAEYAETLRSCLDEVERVTLLVNELLTLARLDAGQEGHSNEVVSLNILAEETVRRLEPIAREHHIDLLLRAPIAVNARIAPGSAHLVMANLLDNAIKFSPPGGRVTVTLAVENGSALLQITDSGPGIQQDELPHLFERFYRGSMAKNNAAPGVGLGLALTQAVVHAHGGNIEASNPAQGGALFTVRLVLAP